jgi:hypothetical protein
MMNALNAEASVCPPGLHALDVAARGPLAVLLLSTDILREYGGQLTPGMLKEQREAMHLAALQLSGALKGEVSSSLG